MDAPPEFISRLTSDVGMFSREMSDSKFRDDTLPKWFAPKSPDAYERWDATDPSGGITVGSLLIDKESGRVFIYYDDF
jgi:hypothetical protein